MDDSSILGSIEQLVKEERELLDSGQGKEPIPLGTSGLEQS